MGRIAGRFARIEPRRRVRALVLGLLSDLARKNCWTLAEHAGHASPDGLRHLLSRTRWDAEAVRADIRDFVVEQLNHNDAVLVVDETGDLKKGTATVGVQRQYTGTAGRIENSQVAVYLAYSTPRGHAAIDRELYLPRSWTEDADRCRAAGIPDTVGLPEPALATRMIGRALDAGVPASWVAGDEVYGGTRICGPRSRGAASTTSSPWPATTRSPPRGKVPRRHPGQEAAEPGLAEALRRRRNQGAPLLRLGPGRHRRRPAGPPHLLVRPDRGTGELAFYRSYSAAWVPLATLVEVAGRRWTVRRPSRPARVWRDWTSTRSDGGRPASLGHARDSPTPSSLQPPPTNVPKNKLRTA
ncbi:IS701 family transposase [Streptomyces sp. NPDC001450]